MPPLGKLKGFKRGRTGLVGCKGARRGLGPAALCDAGARLRLGLCAAGSASLALQVPVTHNHSRPPLALAHSLPRLRRRRRAGQTHQRAPTQGALSGTRGTEDGAGGGDARDPENSAHSHPMRPGEPAPTLQQPRAPRWAAATQRARRGRSELGVTGARGKLKPAHFQPPSSLFFPSRMPSSHSRVMSLTPRGRPRMCPSSF